MIQHFPYNRNISTAFFCPATNEIIHFVNTLCAPSEKLDASNNQMKDKKRIFQSGLASQLISAKNMPNTKEKIYYNIHLILRFFPVVSFRIVRRVSFLWFIFRLIKKQFSLWWWIPLAAFVAQQIGLFITHVSFEQKIEEKNKFKAKTRVSRVNRFVFMFHHLFMPVCVAAGACEQKYSMLFLWGLLKANRETHAYCNYSMSSNTRERHFVALPATTIT